MEDGDVEDPLVVGINVDARGEGDVEWAVTTLSPWDLELYQESVENPDAGGLIQRTDEAVPVTLVVSGLYDLSAKAWSDVTVETVSMTDDEARRRSQAHAQATFELEQELGLRPDDEEIEREGRAPRPPRSGDPHERFRRRERRRRFSDD